MSVSYNVPYATSSTLAEVQASTSAWTSTITMATLSHSSSSTHTHTHGHTLIHRKKTYIFKPAHKLSSWPSAAYAVFLLHTRRIILYRIPLRNKQQFSHQFLWLWRLNTAWHHLHINCIHSSSSAAARYCISELLRVKNVSYFICIHWHYNSKPNNGWILTRPLE